MSSDRFLGWSYLGRVAYEPATNLQETLREELRGGSGRDYLLLLEHPPVYTLGRSADRSDIVASDDWLSERDIEVVECDRGGQVTYHGPGQLVGYPVIDLNPHRRDIRRYVRDLQEVLVRTLSDYGLEARAETRQSLIGVWVGSLKIASIGVHVSRWITTHGFALNVTTDLGHFRGIVPCGLQEVRIASIETLTKTRPALGDVAALLAVHFGEVFDRELQEVSPLDLLAESELSDQGVGPLRRMMASRDRT